MFLKEQLHFPKRAPSPYVLYYAEKYAQKYANAVRGKTMKVTEACSQIAASWKAEPEAVKSVSFSLLQCVLIWTLCENWPFFIALAAFKRLEALLTLRRLKCCFRSSKPIDQ